MKEFGTETLVFTEEGEDDAGASVRVGATGRGLNVLLRRCFGFSWRAEVTSDMFWCLSG